MFCLPIISFFKAIGDFRKTIVELKCSLVHLKEVFSSLLRISQDIEDLTSEVKCIVEFYTNESKTTVRGQLEGLITPEANQELYLNDFYKYYQYLINNELVRLLHEYGYDKQVLDVARRIFEHLRETVSKLKDVVSQDIQRAEILNKIEDFVQQIQQNLIKDFQHNKEGEQSANKENIYIRLFCEQQKISHQFEETLKTGLGVHLYRPDTSSNLFHEHDSPFTGFSFEKEQLYRKRTTRIRELRHYLSSKIKLKKIGDYYREEISLQIQLDLKQASETLNIHEAPIHATIKTWIQILRQLPKHHFKEILDDVKVSEASNAIEMIIEKEVAPELDNLIKDIDLPKTLRIMERQIVKKGKKALLKFEEQENDKKTRILLKGLKELAFSKDKRLPSIIKQILEDNHSNESNHYGIITKLYQKRDDISSKLEKKKIERLVAELTCPLIEKVQCFGFKIESRLKQNFQSRNLKTGSMFDYLQEIRQQLTRPSLKTSELSGLKADNNQTSCIKDEVIQKKPVLRKDEQGLIEINSENEEKVHYKASDILIGMFKKLILDFTEHAGGFSDSVKELVLHFAKVNKGDDFGELVEHVTDRNITYCKDETGENQSTICCEDTKDTASNMLYIDREILQNDVRNVMRPLIEMTLQGSSKLAVFALDKSLFATSEVLEIGLTILKSLKTVKDEMNTTTEQNIGIGSLISALPPPCQQDARKFIFLWKVLYQRKNLRTQFIEKVRKGISDQIVEPSTKLASQNMETYLVDLLQGFMSSSCL